MQLLHLLFPPFDGVQVSIKANDGRICVNRYFFAGTFRYIKIYYLNTHAVSVATHISDGVQSMTAVLVEVDACST